MEELFAAYGDAAAESAVRAKIEATAEDFKARWRAEIVRVIAVMGAADLDLIAAAIERRRAQLLDPAAEARRVAAFRRAAMELARDAVDDDEILGADVVLFYAIEAESRLTGETPYAVAAGDPAAEEALEAVTQRRIRTHCMREWLDRSWPIVSDRAGIILTAEGIARA
ncbi:MAG: hypothetical protein KDB70_13995 [Mycobacterium sp.]|nr:hypothetical protein [Mycobacterium sp.]